MEQREIDIRGRLFRTFGGPCYAELTDPIGELLSDAIYLAKALREERQRMKKVLEDRTVDGEH